MRNLLFSSIMSMLFVCSCNNDDIKKPDNPPDESGLYTIFGDTFEFVPVDANGNNLLKVKNPLTIDDFDIVLYDKKGKPYYFYDQILSDPKDISISSDLDGNDWVCVYMTHPRIDSHISITHLRICDKIHTIKGEFEIWRSEIETGELGGLAILVKKIWFDDKLVVDEYNSVYCDNILIDRN